MVLGRWRSALLVCTAAVFTFPISQVFAQSTTPAATTGEKPTVLAPIVLKGKRATKDAGSPADSPVVSETTAEQIDEKQITSIEDLGRTTEPGVFFNVNNESVNIRGLEQSRVLTTIDGIPIPYIDDGARGAEGGINTFNFDSLSTVDVLRGGDSSRAGSGALGGALILRTLEPEDLIDPNATWGGIFKFGYDSKDRSFGGSAAVAKRIDNTAVLFQGDYRKGHESENNGDVGGYGATRSEENPEDYRSKNFLFKVRQYTDSGHTFGLTAEHYDKDRDIDLMTGQTLTGTYRPGNRNTFNDARRDRVSLDYKYEATDADSLIDRANAVFYWQDIVKNVGDDSIRSSTPIGVYKRDNEFEQRAIGFAGNAEKSFEAGGFDHKVTAGLDISFSKANQYSSGVDSCGPGPFPPFSTCNFLHTNQSDMPDVDGSKVGFFIDDKISVGDSPFSLTPGVRFDWYDYSPKQTTAYEENPAYSGLPAGQSDSQFSPKLRASFEPRPDVEIYAQWSMGFRAPDVEELYLDYGAPGSYLSLGNPDLKPETSQGIEVGANFGDSDLGGHVGLFYNKYRNFIDTETFTDTTGTYPLGITSYFNRDRVRIYGIEANAHKTFDNGFHVSAGISYMNGIDTQTNEVIRSVTPFKAIASAGYATETWGTDVTLNASTGAKDDGDPDTFDAPGYGVVDLTAWWEPEQIKGMTLRAGVYNVFDKTYYEAVNTQTLSDSPAQPIEYYSEAGRTFKVTLTQRF